MKCAIVDSGVNNFIMDNNILEVLLLKLKTTIVRYKKINIMTKMDMEVWSIEQSHEIM